MRFWDGQQWTDQRRERPPAPSPPSAPGWGQGAPARPQWKNQPPAGALWYTEGRPVTGIGGVRAHVTYAYLVVEKGTLHTDRQQIPIQAVHDVDVKQTMTQKARGVFSVTVHAGGFAPVVLDDIPDGREAQQKISEVAGQARSRLQQQQNTHYGTHTMMPMMPPPSTPAAAPTPPVSAPQDPIEQLERLGKLRDAGVLTDAEFEAQKTAILARMS